MSLTLHEFVFMQRITQAFTERDLQTAVTILTWLSQNGKDFNDLAKYVRMLPKLSELTKIGYFHPRPTVEHSKQIRAFEKTLPTTLRRELRRERLANMSSGGVRE